MDNPTYRNIGDHSETIQIDYDPVKISYQELLGIFWNTHSCTVQPVSRQYMSIIFYHDAQQHALALESKGHQEAILQNEVLTEIRPFSKFYFAEDYHQKYYLQGESQIFRDFRLIYPHFIDFINSTAVAKVNGYIGGYGSQETLEEQLSSFGLSAAANDRLSGLGRIRLTD